MADRDPRVAPVLSFSDLSDSRPVMSGTQMDNRDVDGDRQIERRVALSAEAHGWLVAAAALAEAGVFS